MADIPYGARYIVRLIEESGHEAHLVGDCVNVRYICTSASPGVILNLLPKHGIQIIEDCLKQNAIMASIGDHRYEIVEMRLTDIWKGEIT